jgi:hypothetical protein
MELVGSAESTAFFLTPAYQMLKGIFAKFYPLKSTRGAWVGRLTSIRHPCSTWYPFTSSPTSQVSAKTGLNLQKNGQSASHPANIGGCQWMWGLALKIQAPRLPAEARTLLAVWWDLTRSPVHCADGETLWQQHGEQRRRVEVLRSVHRTARAVTGKKTVEIPSRCGIMEVQQSFSACCCLLLSGHVPKYRPGLQVRVRSDVQVRSAAFHTWRLFWFRWG